MSIDLVVTVVEKAIVRVVVSIGMVGAYLHGTVHVRRGVRVLRVRV